MSTRIVDLRTNAPAPAPPAGRRLVLVSTFIATLLCVGIAGYAGTRLMMPDGPATISAPTTPESSPSAVERPLLPTIEAADPVAIGRRLFFDRNLSKDGSVSCADCHQPARSYTSGGRAAKLGGGRLALRAPTLLNRRDGAAFMWDGRARTLEEQALLPIVNPDEMGLTLTELEARTGMRPDAVADALAAFERTLTHDRTPFDDYLDGRNANINSEVARGWQLFRGKAHCAACHAGPNLTDDRLHDTTGSGRKFKTPGLRGVIHAAPYMHDGGVRALVDVIQRYEAGGGEAPRLELTDSEVDDLYELLRAL